MKTTTPTKTITTHKTKHAKLFKQCGVYATAKHLKNRGYTLKQCLDLLKGSI